MILSYLLLGILIYRILRYLVPGPEKSRNNTREKISYFFTCRYSQSAADTSLAFGATWSG